MTPETLAALTLEQHGPHHYDELIGGEAARAAANAQARHSEKPVAPWWRRSLVAVCIPERC